MPAAAAAAKAEAYCVKCRATRTMEAPTEAKSSNGRSMLKGTCSECGTKMNKFVGGGAKA